ncbi:MULTISPECIES: Wzz/FepE/Etk N-terminal domain-containing protein [unclassified Agarivorans]|uniref:Wzz/FepE/Etk N-terminal domain-containing protein n=1 Tax=unclassified Agarivorans TaxID=2636026 RepID=UPI0026E44265|nr:MULTISPECIES: Wzz/FepE/Etk N-terminal domain-containing protein [unclassified Agarivorans]MDO6686255.1 Wzz/FepE/Etk N-terminal domain-containing protein [Agarivorans sp. 3_MG-2023]MDO6716296.1 Wzz/FepE/Etk N-terminal domain-containing protein [Agarivorans sp. 2_MG-2023]
MTQQVQQQQAYQPAYFEAAEDEIDLRELFSVIWRGKWLIIACTVLFSFAAVIYAINQPNIYRASALLAASNQESNKLSGMASQFGGLASLAGINLGGGGGTDQTTLAIEVLKSRQFFSEFVTRYGIKVDLLAANDWNAVSGQLAYDPEIYDIHTRKWLREVKAPKKAEPSMQESHGVFIEEVLSVATDKETGLITIAAEHISPVVAQQWVTWLIKDINQVMRLRSQQETTANISYLTEQLGKTSVAQMQTVFYQLIEEQTKTLMLAEANGDFVFKVVDPAVVAEQKVKPKRALICVLGSLLGGLLGVMIVLVRHFAKGGDND